MKHPYHPSREKRKYGLKEIFRILGDRYWLMGYPDKKPRIWHWDFLCNDKKGVEKTILMFLKGKNLKVLDVGGGVSKYRKLFSEMGHKYTSLDVEEGADIKGDAEKMPIPENSFDFVICMQVLEHVRHPQKVVDEIHRVLKKGGKVFLTAPGIWALHPCPEDNWRFMPGGFKLLFEKFRNVKVSNNSGSSFCFAQNFNIYLGHIYKRAFFILKPLVILLIILTNLAGMALKGISRSEHYVINYTVTAEK